MRGKLLLVPPQEGPQHRKENLLVLRVQGLFHTYPPACTLSMQSGVILQPYPAAITAELLERRVSMSRIRLVLRRVMPVVLFIVLLSGTLTEQPSRLPTTNHAKSSSSLAAPPLSLVNWLSSIWDC